MQADRIISDIAGAQHWAVSRSQLIAAGVPGHVVDHRLRAGLLVPVHHGVYRLASAEPTWEQRITAATLATGGIASHRAAAFLHGLAGVDPRVDVTVERGRAPRPAGIVVHRASALSSCDIEVRNGIARTRVPATLLGLAAVLPPGKLEAALDDALLRGLASSAYLQRRIDGALRGQRGVAALRQLLEVRKGGRWTQSEFERRLLALTEDAGLPRPVPQYEVVLPGGRRAFLDLAWPDARVAAEADSYRHHGSRQAWGRDHTRNNLLTAIGWRILPITWESVVETPGAVASLLFRALAA
ncbi:MAG TPA: type IV toxin-antitoxin system AbiEi family antitoxin domain-containing protein [Acidimicrobiales bacterium]|jgi:hypothetical protein|nr:type IV toxin-antitoxin system AbiEi family antitoxin domain-containing protein [Acidimicrobiales bacterium]